MFPVFGFGVGLTEKRGVGCYLFPVFLDVYCIFKGVYVCITIIQASNLNGQKHPPPIPFRAKGFETQAIGFCSSVVEMSGKRQCFEWEGYARGDHGSDGEIKGSFQSILARCLGSKDLYGTRILHPLRRGPELRNYTRPISDCPRSS